MTQPSYTITPRMLLLHRNNTARINFGGHTEIDVPDPEVSPTPSGASQPLRTGRAASRQTRRPDPPQPRACGQARIQPDLSPRVHRR